MKPRVAIVQVKDNISKALIDGLNLLGGIEKFIKSGESILLKPNLFTTKGPETGATTDMRIVMEFVDLIKKLGCKGIVGECPASASYARPDIVFDGLGVRKLCAENNVDLKVLDRDKPVKIEIDGEILKELWFPETALNYPIINFPKLKTHSLTLLTCAVKNYFGLQQGGSKANHHVRVSNDSKAFSHILLDIYKAIKSQTRLNIVDAIIAMEGEGPTAGAPVNLGLLIIGDDAVAVDIVASTLMGWEPMTVGTNYLAYQRGIGPRGLDGIEVVGTPISNVVRVFKKPQIHSDGQMFIDIRMPLECDPKKCVSCHICEEICPVKAIKVNVIPEFNMSKCIQCFCCVELCPHSALKAIRPPNT